MPFVPIKFNGDILFEVPPLRNSKGHVSQMQGMDRKYDGHVWCKVKKANIKNDFNHDFRKVWCLGHLQCHIDNCKYFLLNDLMNKIIWFGNIVLHPTS